MRKINQEPIHSHFKLSYYLEKSACVYQNTGISLSQIWRVKWPYYNLACTVSLIGWMTFNLIGTFITTICVHDAGVWQWPDTAKAKNCPSLAEDSHVLSFGNFEMINLDTSQNLLQWQRTDHTMTKFNDVNAAFSQSNITSNSQFWINKGMFKFQSTNLVFPYYF